MITLEIPELTPSLNEMLREHRNIHVRKAEQEKWDWLVKEAMQGRWQNAIDCCEITIHRMSNRFLDWDNMGASCKYLLDSLCRCGVIVDDSPKVVKRLHLEQPQVHKSQIRTLVEIIPLT